MNTGNWNPVPLTRVAFPEYKGEFVYNDFVKLGTDSMMIDTFADKKTKNIYKAQSVDREALEKMRKAIKKSPSRSAAAAAAFFKEERALLSKICSMSPGPLHSSLCTRMYAMNRFRKKYSKENPLFGKYLKEVRKEHGLDGKKTAFGRMLRRVEEMKPDRFTKAASIPSVRSSCSRALSCS